MFDVESKKGIVATEPYSLYMLLVDPRNLYNLLPDDKRGEVTVDYDSIHGTVQGFSVGVRYVERQAYSLIRLEDDGAPFRFSVSLHFNSTGKPLETEFYIEVSADLNFMMKSLLGGKIKSALDRIVDTMVDVSHGKLPEGFDPSSIPEGFMSMPGGFNPFKK